MSRPLSFAANIVVSRARPMRLLLLLLASLLLHLIAFNWASDRLGMPSWRDRTPPVMMTELLPPPVKKTIVPPHPKATAKPKPKARLKARPKPRPAKPAPPPKPALPSPPPPPPPPIAEPAPAATPVAIAPPTAEVAPEPVYDTAGNDEPAPLADGPIMPIAPVVPAEQKAFEPPESPYQFSPPPSAELAYDVIALREGQKWYGSGKFQWVSAGDHYSVTGEASITFFFKITVLNFRSEGEINGFGISPALYTEKPFHKPATNTRFQHDAQRISFSASEASYPYHGGEQDRASIIWQLASIGRGDPAQFAPGAAIDVFVAGTRDAEAWHIQVIGQEDIETGYGKMTAWHVARVPRPDSHDQKIDIWLAPQHQWYPVKVLYTYANGDYLDMSLSDLAPGANNP